MSYVTENVWINSRSSLRVSLSEVNSCSDCPEIPKRMESDGPLPRYQQPAMSPYFEPN